MDAQKGNYQTMLRNVTEMVEMKVGQAKELLEMEMARRVSDLRVGQKGGMD